MDRLEELAQRAPNDPEAQEEFYRALLSSSVTVPHQNAPEELKINAGILPAGAKVNVFAINVNGIECVPVFSSPEAMRRAWSQPVAFIRLIGRDFLEMARGSHVALNPGGRGKHLTPEEIDSLLAGDIPGKTMRRIVTQKPEQVLLGQPAHYPSKLVETLKVAFAQYPGVKAAYLAHCFAPSFGNSPHTAIGIDAEDYDTVVVEIGPVVTSVLERDQIVDFVSVRDGGAIADYMLRETKPFYGVAAYKTAPAKPRFWRRLFGK